MLKSFEKEYELFYLFSFENSLMDSGIQFENILSFIEDSIDLDNLIQSPNPEKALEVGSEIYTMQEFSEATVTTVDGLAMELICESSSFRTDGINQFLLRLDPASSWMTSRPSSFDRLSIVNNNFVNADCPNTIRTTSLGINYYVDEILPLIP